jgi:hypothetical protein
MEHKIKIEIKELAKRILDSNDNLETSELVRLSRDLYEKAIVLDYLESVTEVSAISAEAEPEVAKVEKPVVELEESVQEEAMTSPEIRTDESVEENPEEESPPLTLNDLFVPTFDGIKEDMSQKDEFKDTISLDETEKLFVTKKEEVKQLSLNDRLMGKNIQIGLNDRIAFVNKLFNFSQSDFNKVLAKLNECGTRDEAINYFQYQVKPNYNWKGKEDLEERLVIMIERKFL